MTAFAAALALSLGVQGTAAPMRTLDKGGQSGISMPRQVVVQSAEEWAALWRAHAPDRPQPPVDFARETVVAIFMGTRPTAGFAIEIVGYRDAGSDLVVQYREAIPPRDAITAQVLVSPFHVVAIPRRAAKVTFEKAGA